MTGVVLGLFCAFALGVIVAFALVAYAGHWLFHRLFRRVVR